MNVIFKKTGDLLSKKLKNSIQQTESEEINFGVADFQILNKPQYFETQNQLQYSQGKKKQDDGEERIKNPKSYDEFAETRDNINVVDLEPDDLGVTDEFIRQNYDVDDLKLTGIDPSVKEIKKQNRQEQREEFNQQQMSQEAQEKLKKLEKDLIEPEVHPNDKYRVVNDETARTIYVGNISLGTVEDDLLDLFRQFGSIERIKIARSKFQGVKGYAHIVFRDLQSSQRALSAKDNNVILDGKKLLLSQARGMQPKNICLTCGSATHQTIECPTGNAGKNCYLCGKYGHVSKHCPKNYSRMKVSRCFKCGKEGHTLYNCPQNQTR